ncbi:procollagen-lysine,2-oxoglutarate 5-dioxygenase isoform X1 [Bombyx mandarina]|uniref:procollagen-lysine 5-dioxygenase n=2 Tax=Bombyx TaxID=7090 RepID=A0A8R2APN1_BOMMO|nr:procollagen-lysine,2-oxoglutarate 5-dioxygenase isoform X2 [Bombyx mori]XP_028033015.1 procollagen-lysine,2-oxoglutarate 5-dioxygenase isoform X1 [Bombyx mandarina]
MMWFTQKMGLFIQLILCVFVILFNSHTQATDEVVVLTVATDDNHGLERFLRSAKVYNIDVEVLGKGEEWSGGDMNFPGGGQKVILLKNRLEKLMKADNKEKIILFTDSYDVMFLGNLDEIVKKFKSFPDTRVLFSAEQFCWPDAKLATQYPNIEVVSPYLNSGGFIGYLPEIYEIINSNPIKDKDDDQLYYTKIYLDKDLRESLKITLDHKSEIFQNLNGALSDVQLRANTTEEWPYIENVVTKLRPLIVHGNGPVKNTLNHYGNYLAKSWSVNEGCVLCKEKKIQLKEDNLPSVMMAVFIEQATPFLEDFLDQVIDTDYPKNKIHLFIHNNVEYHENEVEKFFGAYSKEYASAKRINSGDFISEAEARNLAKERCINSACDYLFSVDSLSRLESNVLRYLLSSGYDVIAPMLTRPGKAWSNFWGALNSAGFYARSADYMDIVYGVIKGVWNVPFITNCYLLKMSLFRAPKAKAVTYVQEGHDSDMAFCASLRELNIFMYVSNEEDFGHLVNPETYDITKTHPDMYQLFENNMEWTTRYLHPEYLANFEEDRKHLMPCTDVYWFPLMSDRFCDEWIAIMEAYGKWSDGTNNDKRLESGYEAVPTRDIHMSQVGLERHWLQILKDYVRPLQELVFTGYYHNPPASIMNFVVRYRPDEQPSLRPHHDSSTYTINLALNTPNVDYEGGGCRFIRYNCSVRNTKKGWLLMHPGRLTHYHEGLLVTKGTRYIMISFVDP